MNVDPALLAALVAWGWPWVLPVLALTSAVAGLVLVESIFNAAELLRRAPR